jgi:hypothetical protein
METDAVVMTTHALTLQSPTPQRFVRTNLAARGSSCQRTEKIVKVQVTRVQEQGHRVMKLEIVLATKSNWAGYRKKN